MDNTTIEQLVDRIQVQDYANAQPMFAELMASKLHDAIEAEKINVAGQMFNGDDEDDIDDDVDESLFDEEDHEEFSDEE